MNKLKMFGIPLLLLVIIFGGIGLSKSLNWWKTESSKEPARISEGEFSGEYDPADIRGSFSFADIAKSFDVTAEVLAEAFPLPNMAAAEIKAKDIETYYGEMNLPYEIGTGSIRYFTALYTGLPYGGEGALPDTAVAVLERDGKIDVGYIKGLDIGHTESEQGQNQSEDKVHVELPDGEFTITGETTIKEALENGITREELEGIIGKFKDDKLVIKDVVQANGLKFGKIKKQLNDIVY